MCNIGEKAIKKKEKSEWKKQNWEKHKWWYWNECKIGEMTKNKQQAIMRK